MNKARLIRKVGASQARLKKKQAHFSMNLCVIGTVASEDICHSRVHPFHSGIAGGMVRTGEVAGDLEQAAEMVGYFGHKVLGSVTDQDIWGTVPADYILV